MRPAQKFLLWIHRHRGWGWPGLLVYAALVTFPHENVQYVVNEIAVRISHKRLYQASAAIALGEGAILTLIFWLALRKQAAWRTIAVYWVLTIALIFGTWRLLTANNVELVHYPQYVPEGVALMALTLSPVESLAWVTIFGGLDECYQYWDLMGGRPVQYDFNDIYMDLLGGAAGVLLAMVFLRCEPARVEWRAVLRRPGIATLIGIVAAGVVLVASGWVRLYQDKTAHYWFALSRDKPPEYWFINPMFGPHRFHTLSPVEGPVLILATIGVYALLARAVRVKE
ncbi:MAG: hypothetical protein LAO79_18995 [Acidobacteriia bacterium]|nr:hypothetical protein [Terriglobia bacterium]